jgi:hypothetical protein
MRTAYAGGHLGSEQPFNKSWLRYFSGMTPSLFLTGLDHLSPSCGANSRQPAFLALPYYITFFFVSHLRSQRLFINLTPLFPLSLKGEGELVLKEGLVPLLDAPTKEFRKGLIPMGSFRR